MTRQSARMLAGAGLILAALIVWSLRDVAPAWTAKRVTATADLSTTTERDDERVKRAFEVSKQTGPFESGWEPQPNSLRQVRHSRIWVHAPSEAQAVAQVTSMAQAMVERFAAEGAGQLITNVHRRATPIPDQDTMFLASAMRIAALAAGVLGLALIAMCWRRGQSAATWWTVGVVLAVSVVPLLLPGATLMTVFIIGVPAAISATIVYKTKKVRAAAHWPSTIARITKSRVQVDHRTHNGATTTINIPIVEYEFTLGPGTYQGSHITGADNVGTPLPAKQTLDRYPLGASVPVYYNPSNPAEAVLERETAWSPALAYAGAGLIFMAGVVAAVAFLNLDAVMEALRAHFPAGAEPHLAIFFGLCGLWCLFILWDTRQRAAQAAAWPTATGRIVSSRVESQTTRVGGRSGNQLTLFQPVVEYSYEVTGREYHSTQVAFGAQVAGEQKAAEARAARYPPQTNVVVHYDPVNPSNALLETKVAFGGFTLFLGLLFLGLSVYFSAIFR